MQAPFKALLLGGARSGKSRRAEALAAQWLRQPGHEAVMLATAWAGDAEMQARIARHQLDRAQRVPGLQLHEVPVALPEALGRFSAAHRLVLIDCLTLWLTQCRMPPPGWPVQAADAMEQALLNALVAAPGPLVLVSNEIGMGVLPMQAEARACVDALGRLHQQVAERCNTLVLMVAGQPLLVKGCLP